MVSPRPHRVIVVGGGFGGLQAATHLTTAPVELTLVDRRNFHLFQPLTYQVATGALSPGEVCYPLRAIFRRHQNVRVVLGEVAGFDLDRRRLDVRPVVGEGVTRSLEYDTLIVAGGSHYSYFGHDEWRDAAREVKSLESAVAVRARLLAAFEAAELDDNEARRRAWLTFVVVGAGPTGVEMAGQIAELAHRTLRRDFRRIDTTKARVILLDAAPAVLGAFGEKLSTAATEQLRKIGVEVQLNVKVVGVDNNGVDVVDPDGTQRRIPSRCKVWAAGVSASPLGKQLADQSGGEIDRAGRVKVNDDLTLPGHPEVFVVGDMIALKNLPGVAQVAMQGGKHVAGQIKRRLKGEPTGQPFKYFDKGSMATISRFHAVASIGEKVRFAGFIAWLMWLVVHVMYLVGFKNRFTTMVHWAVSFLFRGRSQRTTTRQQIVARTLMARLSAVEEELNQVRAGGKGEVSGNNEVRAADSEAGVLSAEAADAEPRKA
jgi:NADH:ubiquinone reductase (H+-translocating)